MIELKNVKKVYKMGDNEVAALGGVSISIADGEFTAIIGPSGSGKSTLMNILGCLDTPDEGDYFLDGTDMTKVSEKNLSRIRSRKIGFIFQQFNLLQKLTALENVELPMIYQGVPAKERRRRAMESLERVGLGERIHHKPKELSGGQQQRVAIARAFAAKPSIILADEPTGNLDSKSGAEVMTILHQLHESGNTIVLITHDSKVAAEATRRVRIADGLITSDDRNGGAA
ncbi:ABC transporter ATP-binding protein [Ethanoligenens harbinense]|uniref:ABC transporter related protein n=1 Tax=Ethanoligenens harbinense (strain DSM 18485 / JCM 12961 / CGMCC 1.5033 / YUAN-3) TaxID=663278 RepID=E6U5I1_ETHHY|nr:ABC transporter ATP-binding protein [Ethanoligenens harbinense]ADU25648.1 ABC transporter related protein [Ethanoligenens harbinense YUAN-3]AVQ94824.1 ABC transporter ATP-binding protein [Ethanoligenens harbinense YUAN-3]AYF37514.1 ABC transporter ATP-binding protein [Ethanoligenens harbinense]AYF40235.1 ABC transporter ATP-binding protein [Ethanoligenens harbinense]QCN91070.1 ABC transporter ATP-binding protein [Ethanoligenens harbinense]